MYKIHNHKSASLPGMLFSSGTPTFGNFIPWFKRTPAETLLNQLHNLKSRKGSHQLVAYDKGDFRRITIE